MGDALSRRRLFRLATAALASLALGVPRAAADSPREVCQTLRTGEYRCIDGQLYEKVIYRCCSGTVCDEWESWEPTGQACS